MTLPVTIPNTFATATASIPLSQLDTNFSTLANAVNGISDGSETLANAKITTANVTTLIVTGNATIGDASADTVTLNSTMTANTAVIFSAGTSAAPSITTTGDLNTGIYFPGADRVGIVTGGSQRVEVDANGNVGIGTTSPATDARLTISNGGTGDVALMFNRSGTGQLEAAIVNNGGELVFKNGTDSATVAGIAERMRIDSSGNVFIGNGGINASPANGVLSATGGTGTNIAGASLTISGGASTGNAAGGPIIFSTAAAGASGTTVRAAAERMRITSTGEVLVGGTTSINAAVGNLTLTNTAAAQLHLFRNNTTVGTSGVVGGIIGFYGNDTTSNTPTQLAYIRGEASGTHAAGDNPTDLVFGTTPDNTETVLEAARLDNGGRFNVTLNTLTHKPTVGLGTPGGFPGLVILTNEATKKQYDVACNGDSLTFRREGVEFGRFTSGGNFLVGTTSDTGKIRIVASDTDNVIALSISQNRTSSIVPAIEIYNNYTSVGTATAVQFLDHNGATRGTITVTTAATAYNTTSDYRLKENIAPMTGALAKVAALKPCTYTWKANGSAGEGFIAHELQEVCPEAVTGEKDEIEIKKVEVSPAVYEDVVIPAVLDEDNNEVEPERTEKRLVSEAVMEDREVPVYQGVDTSFLVATLTAAIQELKAINDAQAQRIETLEAKVAALESKE